jgi:hypothetical protein
MADYPRITGTIAPTPRNRVSGFLADLLELGAKGYDVGSTLQAGGPVTEGRLSTPVSDLLGIPELQRTLNRVSYNEPLTTGTGYTTRLRPDTVSAAMTVAPMVGPAAKAGAAGARMTGTALKDLATSDVAYNALLNALERSGSIAYAGPRTSKAENIARGLYHPIGEGKKLDKPVSEMRFVQEPLNNLVERRTISPEQLQGAVIIPGTGDRTAAGRLLTEVEGVRLPEPVALEGGMDFMRSHLPYGSAWASDKGVISSLAKRVREAAQQGNGDVYMAYMPMSHVGGDFSTMMTDALLQQVRGAKISKKVKREFDNEVRLHRPEWKGIDSPEARAQLNENGALRHAFIDRMDLDQFKTAGFPSLPTTRAAITEQSLMDVPIHAGGLSIAKMDPSGRIISNPVMPHTTYNTQLGGQYVGGFDRPVPRDFLFSNFTSARRAAGTDPSGDMRSFNLSYPSQRADQQWLDNVMRYMESGQ